MAIKFENLAFMQRLKMAYMLLAYLFSCAVAVVIMIYLPELTGVFVGTFVVFSVALGTALGLGWILTKVVNHNVKTHCPMCNSGQLAENYTLQCRMPEYHCSSCQRAYVDGKIIQK